MSSSLFHVREHTLPTAHIREYPRATVDDQEDILHLAVKEYVPKDGPSSNKACVTIIGAHANGFPKELYEPLWDDLYTRLQAKNIQIRSIWIADVAQQGASGVLNEAKLGNDPSWMDHPRDMFLMVNHFRKHMKRPLIGIGHSMGGNNLVNLSVMHPRLFTSLILIDPVFQRLPSPESDYNPAKASTMRRDIWPNRQAAADKFKSSKFYQTWDHRVLDRWLQWGLRELPTSLYAEDNPVPSTLASTNAEPSSAVPPPKRADKAVTLTTTKHQEVMTFLRPNFPTSGFPDPSTNSNPITHPDVDPATGSNSPFYRPAERPTFHKLPFVRPSVFYIFGDPVLADLSAPVLKADKLAHTGVGVGGSGGVKAGRVSSVTFPGVGHLIPMEVVGKTADACANWIQPELERWQAIEDAERLEWATIPRGNKNQMSEEYKRIMLTNSLNNVTGDQRKQKL